MKRIANAALCALLLAATTTVSAQVPYNLNSFPSASATIYLDFDGQTVHTPYWNGGQRFECAPPALTTAQMERIFNQVAEDYRPFNINITTDSTRYFAAPINRRMRVIITSSSSWYGNAGGVAYIESFRWGLEIPCFVFSNLLNNNAKMVSEAASHEAGHTLGLYHQSLYDANGNYLMEYNPGVGSGEISWAPIMGNSYSRNLTLWHNGPTNWGATSTQNELAIIASSQNGFGYRPDDVGNTITNATPVMMNGNNYVIDGFINSTTDQDVFRMQFPAAGRFILNGTPFNVGGGLSSANIDLRVTLLNSTGGTLAVYNPSASVMAIADTTLNAGTYFIRVENVSNVNTTNYGMLGNYIMQGSFVPNSTLPIYSLQLSGRVNNGQHELNWSIVADEPIDKITIEISKDGRSFSRLTDVSGTTRQYSYQPPSGTTSLHYRLFVVTASQLTYYSNIIQLRDSKGGGGGGNSSKKFKLVTNDVSSGSLALSSTGIYDWRLVDMNGRLLKNGKTTAGMNHIAMNNLSSGTYLLQVIDGTEITTEKIIRR
ncbi:MAG: T9SS type A sorting domain-containing protein [Lacibacter sp.]